MKKVFGYIRVSSKIQNIGRQMEHMVSLGINERDIFIDYKTGSNFNRENYQALKSCLRKGDLLYIESIDRLGRNYKEVLKEWDELTTEICIDIKVIDMPLLDTTQYKDLLGSFVSNLVLQILGFVAEHERSNIKIRQMEGIALAKKKGKKLGRPKVLIPQQFPYYYDLWKRKENNITAKEIMARLNLKPTTFYKLVKEYETNGVQLLIK